MVRNYAVIKYSTLDCILDGEDYYQFYQVQLVAMGLFHVELYTKVLRGKMSWYLGFALNSSKEKKKDLENIKSAKC